MLGRLPASVHSEIFVYSNSHPFLTRTSRAYHNWCSRKAIGGTGTMENIWFFRSPAQWTEPSGVPTQDLHEESQICSNGDEGKLIWKARSRNILISFNRKGPVWPRLYESWGVNGQLPAWLFHLQSSEHSEGSKLSPEMIHECEYNWTSESYNWIYGSSKFNTRHLRQIRKDRRSMESLN